MTDPIIHRRASQISSSIFIYDDWLLTAATFLLVQVPIETFI